MGSEQPTSRAMRRSRELNTLAPNVTACVLSAREAALRGVCVEECYVVLSQILGWVDHQGVGVAAVECPAVVRIDCCNSRSKLEGSLGPAGRADRQPHGWDGYLKPSGDDFVVTLCPRLRVHGQVPTRLGEGDHLVGALLGP